MSFSVIFVICFVVIAPEIYSPDGGTGEKCLDGRMPCPNASSLLCLYVRKQQMKKHKDQAAHYGTQLLPSSGT